MMFLTNSLIKASSSRLIAGRRCISLTNSLNAGQRLGFEHLLKDNILTPDERKEVEDTVTKDTQGWVSSGASFTDRKTDDKVWKLHKFGLVAFMLPFGCGILYFWPKETPIIWAMTEARLEIERREKLDLPLIDKNFIDPEKIILPDEIPPDFKATPGHSPNGKSGEVVGANGEDVVIRVPPGVSVHLCSQNAEVSDGPLPLLGDLDKPGDELVVARGGIGGFPATDYFPRPGEKRNIILDLKFIADFGLIGFPNAGKSSLLKALTAVDAKIASYPFTTIHPQVATMSYPDKRLIKLADLPGLADIAADFRESATELPPLKHAGFLKHLERNSSLVVVVDIKGFQKDLYSPWRSPLDSVLLLASQLERFRFGKLVGKPAICVINKLDLVDNSEEVHRLMDALRLESYPEASTLPKRLIPRNPLQFNNVFAVSALTGENIPELRLELRRQLDRMALENKKIAPEDNTELHSGYLRPSI